MRKSLDLTSLTIDQLAKLQSEIPAVLAQKTEARANSLKSKLAKMAAEAGYGVTLTPLDTSKPTVVAAKNGHAPKAKKGVLAVKVKYRDPKNPSLTWSGRGRPARWLAAYEKAGQKRESFAVA